MCTQRVRGGFAYTSGTGSCPPIAHLRQHAVPPQLGPQPSQLFSIGAQTPSRVPANHTERVQKIALFLASDQTFLGIPQATRQKAQMDPNPSGAGFGVGVPSHFRPRIPGGLPSLTVLSDTRPDRSEPQAPMQMVSGALGSLGFRV